MKRKVFWSVVFMLLLCACSKQQETTVNLLSCLSELNHPCNDLKINVLHWDLSPVLDIRWVWDSFSDTFFKKKSELSYHDSLFYDYYLPKILLGILIIVLIAFIYMIIDSIIDRRKWKKFEQQYLTKKKFDDDKPKQRKSKEQVQVNSGKIEPKKKKVDEIEGEKEAKEDKGKEEKVEQEVKVGNVEGEEETVIEGDKEGKGKEEKLEQEVKVENVEGEKETVIEGNKEDETPKAPIEDLPPAEPEPKVKKKAPRKTAAKPTLTGNKGKKQDKSKTKPKAKDKEKEKEEKPDAKPKKKEKVVKQAPIPIVVKELHSYEEALLELMNSEIVKKINILIHTKEITIRVMQSNRALLKPAEITLLIKTVDACFPGFLQRIHEDFRFLKKENDSILCMLFLGMQKTEIAAMIGRTHGGISKRCFQLSEEFETDMPLKDFLISYAERCYE